MAPQWTHADDVSARLKPRRPNGCVHSGHGSSAEKPRHADQTLAQAKANHQDKASGLFTNHSKAIGTHRTGKTNRPKRVARMELKARPDGDRNLGRANVSPARPITRIAAPPSALEGPGRSMAMPSATRTKQTAIPARPNALRIGVFVAPPNRSGFNCNKQR